LEGNGGRLIEVISLNLSGGTEENKNYVRIAGVPGEIRTDNLANITEKRDRYNPIGSTEQGLTRLKWLMIACNFSLLY
jgi:hypothetical protein